MAPHSEEAAARGTESALSKEAPNGLKEASKLANTSKAPLKLKGALDQFKSFDVTPVIGKEFPDASLVDWLKAPNSDELIRDLAITGSGSPTSFQPQTFAPDLCCLANNVYQSLNAESSSFVLKRALTTIFKKSWHNASENCRANPVLPNCISIRSPTLVARMVGMTMK